MLDIQYGERGLFYNASALQADDPTDKWNILNSIFRKHEDYMSQLVL